MRPKGGTLNLGNPDRGTSFSTLNPYLLNTEYSYGTYFFSFETLCDPSEDEAGVMYGLVAEAILVAPDFSSVSFRLNPRAHFNNGDPVTASDVKYSFDTLVSDQANPGYAATLALAKRAVVVDARTIRFDLAVASRDSVYTLGTFLPVFSPKWGLATDGKRKPFSKIIDDLPIATGAYLVARTYNGRRLDLVRDPNYWARDEGVRRGFYNFDKIVYRYYADSAVQFEALKAGDIDLFWETNLKRWGAPVQGRQVRPGKDRPPGAADRPGHLPARAHPQRAAAQVPRRTGPRGTPALVRLRVAERAELRSLRARRQRLQQLRVRRQWATLGRRARHPRAV